MTDMDLLAELREWQRQIDEVKFHAEPTIYVTPEEMVQLRLMITREEAERELLGIPTRMPTGTLESLLATPVVVDREKTAEQRARWRAEGSHD